MADSTAEAQAMLAQVDLFAGSSNRRLKGLAGLTKVVTHDAGQEIAAEGRGAHSFHLIMTGTANVTRGGKKLRQLGPGDYFGEISLIDGQPRSATVTASSALKTLAINHTSFEQLLKEDPQFSRALLKMLCGRLRATEK